MECKDSNCNNIEFLQRVIGGKWKIIILWNLKDEVLRFGELHRRLGIITQSTLTKQLRELEFDGLITRYIYREIPPKVEYSLSKLGKSFIPVLEYMQNWADSMLGKE